MDSPLKALSARAQSFFVSSTGRRPLALSDLVALALELKTVARAYSLSEYESQRLVGMTLSYYAIRDGGFTAFAPVKEAFTDASVYPDPVPGVLDEISAGFDAQLCLERGETVTFTQEARDSGQRWRFLVSGDRLDFNVNPDERWRISPLNVCNAFGNWALTAKEGYIVPGAYEGGLVIGRSDGLSAQYSAVKDQNTSFDKESELKAIVFIANDDLNCIYGVGFADNTGELHVTVSYKKP